MQSSDVLERIHRYIIASRQVDAEPPTVMVVGPFTVLLHPSDAAVERNIAVPSAQDVGAPDGWRESLRAAFLSHGRKPAVQWIAPYAPQLETVLQAAGFTEHSRNTVLACAPGELRAPAPLPGLSVITISDVSSVAEMRENLDANAFGFDPAHAQPATDEQAARFLAELTSARAFTARRDGRAVGAGMYIEPREGVTELAGIATLEPFRGQGIAAALTTSMTQVAFANGCDLVYLTTTNPVAARVYARVGFQPIGDELTYVASA